MEFDQEIWSLQFILILLCKLIGYVYRPRLSRTVLCKSHKVSPFVARNTENKSHEVENGLNPGVMYVPSWNLILSVKGLTFQHPERKSSFWNWGWLAPRTLQCQSLSAVLLRTPFTWTIKFHGGISHNVSSWPFTLQGDIKSYSLLLSKESNLNTKLMWMLVFKKVITKS